jgi:HEAT repeat protein
MDERVKIQTAALLARAGDFADRDFRLLVEDLAKTGGEDALGQIVDALMNRGFPMATRLNLVRIAGYLRQPGLVEPLQQLIEYESDPALRLEAIISIAKYNDQRALEILSRALDTIDNPTLLDTIKSAISRIRQNNPLIAMMPNFLLGSTQPDIFMITMKILRKIITAEDLKNFVPYLRHPDWLIRRATFELLCLRGNEAIAPELIHFLDDFAMRLKTLHANEAPFCLWALQQFGQFASKYPTAVLEAVPVLLVIQKKLPFEDIRKRIDTLLMLFSSRDAWL